MYLPLPSQPKLVLIYRPRRDGRLSWSSVAGWLHTEIDVRHRELSPDTVAHLSTNRARRRLTSLIEANVLTTTPDHQNVKCAPVTKQRYIYTGNTSLQCSI